MRRILVTEHVEANRLLLENAFAKLAETFEVTYVDSADACLDYLQKSDNYELCFVLLDLNVPGVVENSLVERLSVEEAFRTIPVIIFSENVEAQDIVSCYNNGANAFVRRPSSAEAYQCAIASITDFWGNINVLAKPETVLEF